MKKVLLFIVIFSLNFIYAQSELVFVYFNAKPNKAAFYANPNSELTQKSLDRRSNLGISLNDQDAPIEPTYIQNIVNLGFTVTDYSKWLNGVAVNATAAQVLVLQAQPYVQSVESFAKNSTVVFKTEKINKLEEFNKNLLTNFNYGQASAQIDQINLRSLHVNGFTGTGITIAVLDSGFPTVDTGSTYQRIRNLGNIKGGYNFISKNADIYNTSLNNHGSIVFGAIAGFIDNSFVGSAPDADFYLYATENGAVEIPEEQLYWIEAAEDADRKGVDIITVSLGYTVFDDARYNYTYADMNGTSTFISRAAQIAAEKGIFVLSAAGNSGEVPWQYISAPADNAKVFTIGAVDSSGIVSGFSSFGPNFAGVIKPDAAARGTATETVFNNTATAASGTSLAAPVAAGGVACLLQALPSNISRDFIKTKLRETASLFPNPTAQGGYGILNFGAVLAVLNTAETTIHSDFEMFPNPARDFVQFKTKEKILSIKLFDQLGRIIKSEKINDNKLNVSNLETGVYYLIINTEKNSYTKKLIKE
ncbi:S8/S53 family peptidase [Frigoriflavimonas asaccharolytica]|uniref:Secreted protein (Por secretion system target) n=1 Tax=Frigoriflavimonas asaccharolytica TaxID=2735899 RepID=A0A8J8G5W4_9FLAO|nr:S8/S53 family peptidase [Frigoriflavimonas asaccharolytica]NRS91826.1 hypothetical protein [Frigoriflavimonas asaccharolytica]